MFLKFWTSGSSMVRELWSPLDPRVCSKRISTFRDCFANEDCLTASWIQSTWDQTGLLCMSREKCRKIYGHTPKLENMYQYVPWGEHWNYYHSSSLIHVCTFCPLFWFAYNILILIWGLHRSLTHHLHCRLISNSNWTEWSTIQGVIGRVISNRARPIWNYKHDYSLNCTTRSPIILINHNYNKIREEYDSGLNYLTGLYIQLLSYMPKKKAIQVQLARARWHVLSNYSGMTRTTVQLQVHDVCNCTITAEIRPADDQSDSRILI